jgi:hypothetical protein
MPTLRLRDDLGEREGESCFVGDFRMILTVRACVERHWCEYLKRG